MDDIAAGPVAGFPPRIPIRGPFLESPNLCHPLSHVGGELGVSDKLQRDLFLVG